MYTCFFNPFTVGIYIFFGLFAILYNMKRDYCTVLTPFLKFKNTQYLHSGVTYSPFHKTLPKSREEMLRTSVKFYEMVVSLRMGGNS